MAAQLHHYVPRFVLRQFLSDVRKEQVAVYDKHTDRSFVVSINNIMSERRFNEFQIDDYSVSFEGIATKLEKWILPRYQTIIDKQRLERTVEEKVDLAFLIAFQFLRVKAVRDLYVQMETIRQKVEKAGGRMEDVNGWSPLTEDKLKSLHLQGLPKSIGNLAEIIATKDFVLARVAKDKTFYIGDNPVARHNQLDFGPYGNLGFALKGIQVYLPLSSELTLCAYCPSIISGRLEESRVLRNKYRLELQRQAVQGIITFTEMSERATVMERECKSADKLKECFSQGRPVKYQRFRRRVL